MASRSTRHSNQPHHERHWLVLDAHLVQTDARLFQRRIEVERQWLLAMDRYRDALDLDSTLEQARVGLDQVRIKHEPMPLVTGLI